MKMIFVSNSKFFLEGISRILEEKWDGIKIVTMSSSRGIKNLLNGMKPEFLFFDNRTLKLNIKKLMGLIIKESPHAKIILFSKQANDKIDFPNVEYISRSTSSLELISIIKRGTGKVPQVKKVISVVIN